MSIPALITLRLEMEPYPHLRDSEGCVLARDYVDIEKLKFIIDAVKTQIARDKAERE